MEPKLGKVYLKALKVHRSGEIRGALRFYLAVLRTEPSHPDAIYNMGMLSVHEGKIPMALEFFETALHVNPYIFEFWLSYLKTLLKLNKKKK